MKTKFIPLKIGLLLGIMTVFSCQEDDPVVAPVSNPAISSMHNQPPIANAGFDKIIGLPTNKVVLNGGFSTDPDRDIKSYLWTKISGPSSFNITSSNAANTEVTGLIEGAYQFELKVTDAMELSDKDTVSVRVLPVQETNGNVYFYLRDPTGVFNDMVLEGFNNNQFLVTVKIANYPEVGIQGVWGKNRTPICPIMSNYVDLTAFGSIKLPPGTYEWTAESVISNLNEFPVPPVFNQYWESGAHNARGTVTIQEGDNCILKEILF